MDHILLHVTYTCKPGTAETFVRTIKERGIQQQVRDEDGCLQYDYHISCEKPDTVVLLEQWRDKAALQAHTAGDPFKAVGATKAEYVLHADILRFQ